MTSMKASTLFLASLLAAFSASSQNLGHESTADERQDSVEASLPPDETSVQQFVARKMKSAGRGLYEEIVSLDHLKFGDTNDKERLEQLIAKLQKTAKRVEWEAVNADGDGIYTERLLKYICPTGKFAADHTESFNELSALLTKTESTVANLLEDPKVQYDSASSKKSIALALSEIRAARNAQTKNKPSDGSSEEAYFPKTKDEFRILITYSADTCQKPPGVTTIWCSRIAVAALSP